MVIGSCRIKLHIHGNDSLKGKRSVLRPLLVRVRREFNVSAAETGAQDAGQLAEIGLAAVSSDAKYVDGLLQKAVAWIEQHAGDAEVVDFEIEILRV